MRVAGKTRVSFSQFFRDYLKGVLGSKVGMGRVQDYLRKHHGETYSEATKRM